MSSTYIENTGMIEFLLHLSTSHFSTGHAVHWPTVPQELELARLYVADRYVGVESVE